MWYPPFKQKEKKKLFLCCSYPLRRYYLLLREKKRKYMLRYGGVNESTVVSQWGSFLGGMNEIAIQKCHIWLTDWNSKPFTCWCFLIAGSPLKIQALCYTSPLLSTSFSHVLDTFLDSYRSRIFDTILSHKYTNHMARQTVGNASNTRYNLR
jgi:hypothetical protein